ncbi:hypothetical protein D7Z12_21035, partial [Escherichia coli]|nr:hypothetical protein [Escherichia coli]
MIIAGQSEKLGGDPCKAAGRGGQAKGAPPCAPLARSAPACAGVNAARPAEAAAPHATMQHGANVIQHNAGDYAHSRRVAMMANPIRCARLVFAQSALCPAPPRSAPWSVQRKASLALRSAVGSGAVLWPRSRRPPWRLRCRSVAASSCGRQSKEVVGL